MGKENVSKVVEKEGGGFGSGLRDKISDALKRTPKITASLPPPASSAGTAVKGAVIGASAAAGTEAVGSIKDPGFLLFIVGALAYFFNLFGGNPTLKIILNTIFLFYTAFFIFNRQGFVTIIIFWLWYIPFGARTDPAFFLYFAPIAGVILVGYGLITKGQGFKDEARGLVPILCFFLDLGLIGFLTKTLNFPLTGLLTNLILFMPWWALLGLFTTKKENFFITIAKLAGIIYIFSILVIGTIPDLGYAKSTLPGPEQFLEAEKTIKEQLPQTENPAWSNLVCVFSEPTNVQTCVQSRQENSELNYICEKIEKKEPKTSAFDQCLKEQKERKQKEGLAVSGVEDSTMRNPTNAEFLVGEYFPKITERVAGEEVKVKYPLELKIENPRQQGFTVEVSCWFNHTSKKESYLGIVASEKTFPIKEETTTKTVVCQPPPDAKLDGSYKITYEAKFLSLKTTSRLQRAFIGKKTPEQKQSLIKDIMKAHFPGKSYLSQAPPEFARINFAFGNPLENPLVEQEGSLLAATIENVGSGKILAIKRYDLKLDGFDVDPNTCLSGEDVKLPTTKTSSKKTIYLPSCFIKTLPPELQNPPEYVYKEFEAELVYDYSLSKEIPIEVRVYGAEEGKPIT